MKKVLFLFGIVFLSLGVPFAYTAGTFVSPVEVTTCGAGDFVNEITATGAVNCDTPPGAPSAANPTAIASDTAVNGAATTYMRSDAAPAIQKATSGQFGVVEVDGTTIKATAGVISIDLTNANSWTGQQSFAAVKGTASTQAGTTYTIQSSDCGKTIVFTSSSAITVTTLAAIVSGTDVCAIAIRQKGTGQVTIANGAGATQASASSFTKTRTQYSLIGLTIEPDSPSLYVIDGDGA